jgi:hypothetical protein
LPRRRVFFFCEDSDMGNHPPCNIQALLEHCSTSNHPNDKAFHDIFLAAAGYALARMREEARRQEAAAAGPAGAIREPIQEAISGEGGPGAQAEGRPGDGGG